MAVNRQTSFLRAFAGFIDIKFGSAQGLLFESMSRPGVFPLVAAFLHRFPDISGWARSFANAAARVRDARERFDAAG